MGRKKRGRKGEIKTDAMRIWVTQVGTERSRVSGLSTGDPAKPVVWF